MRIFAHVGVTSINCSTIVAFLHTFTIMMICFHPKRKESTKVKKGVREHVGNVVLLKKLKSNDFLSMQCEQTFHTIKHFILISKNVIVYGTTFLFLYLSRIKYKHIECLVSTIGDIHKTTVYNQMKTLYFV